MRRITLLAAATTAALIATAHTVSAQTPQFALEVRGGYAIPTGDWNEDDTFNNGFGFGADVIAMVTPQVGIYAGWEMVQFDVDEDVQAMAAVREVEVEVQHQPADPQGAIDRAIATLDREARQQAREDLRADALPVDRPEPLEERANPLPDLLAVALQPGPDVVHGRR